MLVDFILDGTDVRLVLAGKQIVEVGYLESGAHGGKYEVVGMFAAAHNVPRAAVSCRVCLDRFAADATQVRSATRMPAHGDHAVGGPIKVVQYFLDGPPEMFLNDGLPSAEDRLFQLIPEN